VSAAPDLRSSPDARGETTASNPSALVLFSGGQDSTTCLASALTRFGRVETVGFDYGQRHAVELECRNKVLARIRALYPAWARRLGDDTVLELGFLKAVSDTALTRDRAIEIGANGLPTTFVPGRNILFLAAAAALAWRRGHTFIVGGMCETDFSGYPDCRDDTIKALQVALNLGMDAHFILDTPLMRIDKAATWRLARELGGDGLVKIIVEDTHTCYLGERSRRWDWGYGCGTCPACELRARGYAAFSREDGAVAV
jgi:7-cyano-7-deazaguanine synthase